MSKYENKYKNKNWRDPKIIKWENKKLLYASHEKTTKTPINNTQTSKLRTSHSFLLRNIKNHEEREKGLNKCPLLSIL